MTIQTGANLYTQGFGSLPENVEIPFVTNRAPSISDYRYPIGKRWINSSANTYYVLTSVFSSNGSISANWIELEGVTADVYPITPYVVGPAGLAGYQTVQSAVNQANIDIGDSKVSAAAIYVMPGTYSENLTLYTKISIVGTSGDSSEGLVTIVGVHTPPTSGEFSFVNLTLGSSTDIFSSTAAGTASLDCVGCFFEITGWVYNLLNWTGPLGLSNCADNSTANALVHCSAAATVTVKNCQLGSFTIPMTAAGVTNIYNSIINVAFTQSGSSACTFINTIFNAAVTINSSSSAIFDFCSLVTGTASALTMSSSEDVDLNTCYISSSNDETIAGAGAGTLTLTTVAFETSPVFSGTLTLAWSPTYTGSIVAEGNSVVGGGLSANTFYATEDNGGVTATVGFTFTNSTSVSSGTGTIKMTTTNNANSSAWIKIYIGTTAYYIPCFTTDAP